MNGYVESLWTRTRQARMGFITGIIVGALAGWFFHGVISFIVRFFFVIVLLIPFAIALIAWWRLRRQVQRAKATRPDWDEWPPPRRVYRRSVDDPTDSGPVITVDAWDAREPAERTGPRGRSPGRDGPREGPSG